MRSLADTLPPEMAAAVHPDWRANERAYWAVRDALLTEYAGQYVSFDDGTVVASGTSAVTVLHAGQRPGRHPFFVRVGAEFEPTRIRRAAFAYDSTYAPEPLPQLAAEFRAAAGRPGATLSRVIPDTGADNTVLPWADCRAIGFDPAAGRPGFVGGVGGSAAATLTFQAWVVLDGTEYPCQLQADPGGTERLLGRDVLNRLDILFRGPAGEVVVNP